MIPAIAVAALILIAAVLVPAHMASAQRGGDPSCSTAGAVSDAANNPGLVSDCETLLAARDILVGTASLNWSVSTPIDQWEGVTVSGSPLRVTALNLRDKALTGEIPPGLAGLSNLQLLFLSNNELSGPIPAELGGLSELQRLTLYENQLGGEIPVELGAFGSHGYVCTFVVSGVSRLIASGSRAQPPLAAGDASRVADRQDMNASQGP